MTGSLYTKLTIAVAHEKTKKNRIFFSVVKGDIRYNYKVSFPGGSGRIPNIQNFLSGAVRIQVLVLLFSIYFFLIF